METINFLLRDRGDWDPNPNTSYAARDGVRLGVSQYYTLTEIASGDNTFSPDDADARNPWDLLVSGNLDNLMIQGDNTIVTSNPDLTPREVQANAEGEILTYDSASAIAENNRVAFGPPAAFSALSVYRFSLNHNGFSPELDYPAFIVNRFYLTFIGDIEVTCDEIRVDSVTGRSVSNRSLLNFPYGFDLEDRTIVRLVHGIGEVWAFDNENNVYSTSTNPSGNASFTRIRTATTLSSGSQVEVSDPTFTNIIPIPYDETSDEGSTGVNGAFYIRSDRLLYYAGQTTRITGPLLDNGTLSLGTGPTIIERAMSIFDIDRIRNIGRFFAFRSPTAGTHRWSFLMRDGQAQVVGLNDATSLANSNNSTLIISNLYNEVEELIGIRGFEQWIFGFNTSGQILVAGSQIGINGPVTIRLPQIEVEGVMVDQNVVEMSADVYINNASGLPAEDQAIPNLLIRSDMGRVYFVGNRAILGTGATGVTPIVVVNNGSTTDININFDEVTLPAGKTPMKMKWGARGFHILFTDGTLYGGGLNEHYHLGIPTGGTTVPQPLSKVGNLPYDVVDWGYEVTGRNSGPSSEFNSEVRLRTKFLLRDSARGGTNSGIYFTCGTSSSVAGFGLGVETSLSDAADIDNGTGLVVRYPRHISNSQGEQS